MSAVLEAVTELTERGVTVLSPADPRVVDQIGEFVFVASDRVRSIKIVEDRHLECIAVSNFLWLVAPDGYVGQSASMELGFAVAKDVPVFSQHLPSDGTLRKYVQCVSSIGAALSMVLAARQYQRSASDSLLIDPVAAVDSAQRDLEGIRLRLTTRGILDEADSNILLEDCARVARLVTPSTSRRCKATR